MEFVDEQLAAASAAPASEYNRGYLTALEEVAEFGKDQAWEEGVDVDD